MSAAGSATAARRGRVTVRTARRLAAAAAAALLVAGCGTRLDDGEIIKAATHIAPAPGQPAGSDPAATEAASGAAAPATDGATPTADAGAAPVTSESGTGALGSGTSGAAAGSRNVTGAPQSATAGSGAANRGGSVGAGGAAGRSDPGRPSTPGAASSPAAGPSAGAGSAAGAGQSPAGVAPGGSAAAKKSVVVLGNVGDYSGIVGNVLKEGGPMAQVVARHINDNGGLNGHPVKILVADAAGDPSRALSIVRDMVESKGVVAFMANLWVLSGAGARSYLEQKRIPVIGGEVASSHWFQSPMWFPQASSFPTLSVGAAKTMVDIGKKKIAIAYCAEVEACKIYHDSGTARAAEVGATIVYTAQVSLAQPDYTAECLQAQRAGAEALMLGVDSTGLSRFARSCLQQNYRVPIVTVSLATIASTTKDRNLDGLYSPVGTFPYAANDIPATQEYRAAIARYAPTIEEGGTTSAVWTAGALLREVGKALPVSPGPQDFLNALWQVKNNNLGGLAPPLTYAKDQPAPDIRCYFLQQISGGRFTAPHGTKQICL